MPYCPQCGVEVDHGVRTCPLCEFSVPEVPRPADDNAVWQGEVPSVSRQRHSKRTLRHVWEIGGIAMVCAMVVVLVINYSIERKLTWSLYPATGMVFGYFLLSLPLFLFRRPFFLWFGSLVTVTLHLWVLDRLDGDLTWFVPLALPVSVAAFLILGLSIWTAFRSKRQGANLIAWILLYGSVFCVFLDMIMRLYAGAMPMPRWSLIVLAANAPLVVLLLYYHYRVDQEMTIRKFFHI